MSKFQYIFKLYEVQIDDDNNFLREFQTNLPHHKEISENFCNQWNKDHDDYMLKLINEECSDVFESCKMKSRINNGDTELVINFITKPQKRLTHNIKVRLCDFMSAQMSDGWGEGMLGYANIMEKNGVRFYAD